MILSRVRYKVWNKLFAIIFIMLMVMVGHFQHRYDNSRVYLAQHDTFVTLPSGKTLRILSFGYRNLAADLLFIWAIQFYSSYHLTNMYDYLEGVFNTITDLTPEYLEPYIVGSWIMALEAKDVQMAIRLLQKGSKSLPDQWIFDYECGFYAYKSLKDYRLASTYFDRAAAHPTAPEHVKRKKAHMVYMMNDLDYAYRLWEDIYKTAEDRMTRDAAYNHLFQIKYEKDRQWLEEKIILYRSRYQRNPHRLEDLVRAGIVQAIPRDFDGTGYLYDPKTGEIKSQRMFKWKKS